MAKPTPNRRQFIGTALGSLWVCGLERGWGAELMRAGPSFAPSTAADFAFPPDAAKPWVYWMWLNGHVTREGITADLEAMKAVGINGALIMNLGSDESGPVRFMSSEWQAMFRHAVAEAARLGLTIDMNNDDGWNCGGPSITPANAMQKVVWTETPIQGPARISVALPQPPLTWNFYRDICTVAFRRPDGDEDDSIKIAPRLIAAPSGLRCLELEFAEPFAARSIVVSRSGAHTRPASCELRVSDDGREFRTVCRFKTGWEYPAFVSAYPSVTVGFRKVRGRFYRLLTPDTPLDAQNQRTLSFRLLGGSRISFWDLKGGFTAIGEYGTGIPFFEAGQDVVDAEPPEDSFLRARDVIDLSSRVDSTGHLNWTVPPGNWTVLRIGYTPTGQLNAATTKEGQGPDCNKLSPTGVQAQFRAVLEKLILEVGPTGAKSFTFGHNDSWESKCQNWTDEFRKEFHRRRGYDLLSYLPVLAGGRVVESPEISERFLWDMRRTLADLIAEYYWKGLWKECKAHGLNFTQEASGRQQFMGDPINYLSQGDIPMGEFWMGELLPRPDCKLAASTAHVYGRPLAGAEAFTSTSDTSATSGEWLQHPFSLKAKGDIAFCTGINHLTFHRYVLQPWLNRKPGLTWGSKKGGIGTSFERTQTWWKPGAAWIQYLSRCQAMLQRGRFAADVCVFTGESVPNVLFRPAKDRSLLLLEKDDPSTSTEIALTRSGLLPTLPPSSYDFDGCDLKTLSQFSVEDGRLVLPHGMSYRLLTLPPTFEMTSDALRVIGRLVKAGAVVMGPKPAASPGLSNFPACDDQVQSLANEIWGPCDGKQVKEHVFGKGKVVWGKPIDEVLVSIGVSPDFEYKCLKEDSYLDFIHRTDGEAEIYFISNQRERFEEAECTFRVSGKVPELWDSATGRTRTCAMYKQSNGMTLVPLCFDPHGSVFVVFRRPARGKSVVALSLDGNAFPWFDGLGEQFRGVKIEMAKGRKIVMTTAVPGQYELSKSDSTILSVEIPPLPGPLRMEGHWEVHFPPDWGAPQTASFSKLISWTEHANEGIRYFSGTATYVREFEIEPKLLSRDYVLYLDLGRVKEIASVRLNGRNLEVLWKPPFRMEISGALNPGKNRIEIDVTNLWPNRMIGDLRLAEGRRYTWTNWNGFTSHSPLLESGLIGPVVIQVAARKEYSF